MFHDSMVSPRKPEVTEPEGKSFKNSGIVKVQENDRLGRERTPSFINHLARSEDQT